MNPFTRPRIEWHCTLPILHPIPFTLLCVLLTTKIIWTRSGSLHHQLHLHSPQDTPACCLMQFLPISGRSNSPYAGLQCIWYAFLSQLRSVCPPLLHEGCKHIMLPSSLSNFHDLLASQLEFLSQLGSPPPPLTVTILYWLFAVCMVDYPSVFFLNDNCVGKKCPLLLCRHG